MIRTTSDRFLHRDCSLDEAACQLATYAFAGGPDGGGLPVAAIRQFDGKTWQVTSRDVLTGANIKDAITKGAERRFYLESEGIGEPGITFGDLQVGLREVLSAMKLNRTNAMDYLDLPVDVAGNIAEVTRAGVHTRYRGQGQEH